MAFLDNFNPDEIDTAPRSFDFPKQWIPVVVVDTKDELNSKNIGKKAIIKFQAIEGPLKNRYIFQTINYEHASEKCEGIGKGELARLMNAVGVDLSTLLAAGDFSPFHGLVLEIEADRQGKFTSVHDCRPFGNPQVKPTNSKPSKPKAPPVDESEDLPEDDIPF